MLLQIFYNTAITKGVYAIPPFISRQKWHILVLQTSALFGKSFVVKRLKFSGFFPFTGYRLFVSFVIAYYFVIIQIVKWCVNRDTVH